MEKDTVFIVLKEI